MIVLDKKSKKKLFSLSKRKRTHWFTVYKYTLKHKFAVIGEGLDKNRIFKDQNVSIKYIGQPPQTNVASAVAC